jgi:hypothetical protein
MRPENQIYKKKEYADIFRMCGVKLKKGAIIQNQTTTKRMAQEALECVMNGYTIPRLLQGGV